MAFVNLSAHMSANWSPGQLEAALEIGGGEIRELVFFPGVPPTATVAQVMDLATELANHACKLGGKNPVVMVQCESTLQHSLVSRLRQRGLRVVAATSQRQVVDIYQSDGSLKKESTFVFVAFRDYE